jgi:hypothetical protein
VALAQQRDYNPFEALFKHSSSNDPVLVEPILKGMGSSDVNAPSFEAEFSKLGDLNDVLEEAPSFLNVVVPEVIKDSSVKTSMELVVSEPTMSSIAAD